MSQVDLRQRALLEALAEHDVEFIVIGGVAAQLHGWRGATLDLDISIAVEEANRARLERALVRLRARQIGIGPNGTAFTTRFGRLEIVSRADGIGRYEHWKASAVRIAWTSDSLCWSPRPATSCGPRRRQGARRTERSSAPCVMTSCGREP